MTIDRDALIAGLRSDAGDYARVMRGDTGQLFAWDQSQARAWEAAEALSTLPAEVETEWEGAMVCEGFDPIPITNSKDGSKAFQTLVFYGAEISKIQVARRRKAGPWEVVSDE